MVMVMAVVAIILSNVPVFVAVVAGLIVFPVMVVVIAVVVIPVVVLGRVRSCEVFLVPIDGFLGFMMIVPIVFPVVVVVIVPIVIPMMVVSVVIPGRVRSCEVFLVPVDGFLRFMMIVSIVIPVMVVIRIMRGFNVTVGVLCFRVPTVAMSIATVSNSAQYVGQSDYRDSQYQQGSGAGYAPSKSGPESAPSISVF